jgi:23S rRNA pseudouridine1911/1915/1917 synthase
MRLDVVLVQRVAGMSRAQARRLTSEGKVRINGRRAKKGDPLVPGDRVELEELPIPTDFTAAPDPDLPLAVVYEDARLVAVDKPPQVPSHPLRPDERGTVAGALAARYPEMRSVGYSPREPGIVHRLDTDTSGLLVAARDEATFDALRSDLKAGRWEKRYTAMVSGHLGAPRIVDFPLCRDPQDRRRVLACLLESEVLRYEARPAETELLSAEPIGPHTLVEVRARTASRHQIRAHLAALGHPLVGDALYEGPSLEGLSRHFLHASRIELELGGDRIVVESLLAPDLRAAVDALGRDA